MSTAKKQKAIRIALLNKIAGTMHIPQSTLREEYLGTFSLLVENDPAGYTREMLLDADQLNFFLNDRARSSEIVKAIEKEEKERVKEQEKARAPQKKPKKESLPKPGTLPEAGPVAVEPAGTEPVKAEPANAEPVHAEPVKEPEPATVPSPEPGEKKTPARTQSTLFDGF